MCGIFGFVSHHSESVPEKDRLRETANLMQHRGPDARGFYVEPGIAFVHTRLSLLDLSERGNQPFWDKENRYALIYNGEIYNFRDLQAELEREGVQFKTTCDTEVVLEALLKWGPDITLPKLEGMFAFALFDRQEKSLLLARDRFGIKPLFIYETDESFAFASEIRTMGPWIPFEPDLHSISSYLYSFGGPHTGRSFYQNIRSLDAGAVLEIRKKGKSQTKRFFTLPDFLDREEEARLEGRKMGQLVDELDVLLNESVKSQLIADAPVGGLCSGGVDSSIILSIASRYHNNLAIFHANVLGPQSELEGAMLLANHLKLDLKCADVKPSDFITEIPNVIKHYGHPFYRTPHSLPFLSVSRVVRQNGVKAVLTGEGSDECFLGYSFLAPNLKFEWKPRRLLGRLKRWILRQKLAEPKFRYLSSPDILGGDINSDSGFVIAMQNRFEILGEALEMRSRMQKLYGAKQPRGVLASLDLYGYSLRALLHRDDSMGMAASIEARFPFLDSKLVRFALNCPYRSKIRFSPWARDPTHIFYLDKYLLRQVAKRYLPDSLSQRKKTPFPVSAYYPSDMTIGSKFLKDSFIRRSLGLTDDELKTLTEQASHDLKWKMLQLDLWIDICLRNQPEDAVRKINDNLTMVRKN
jgi:asparagine synthase (glutamine-hydrolysing)